MLPRTAHVLSGVVEGLLQTGSALGLDRATLLAEAHLDEAALLDRDARLPLAKQVIIGRAIIAARPGVNVAVAMLRRLQPGALGALGYALAHCDTLGAALSVFVRYQGFVTDALRWRRPDDVTLVVDADEALAAIAHPVETAVGLWVALGRRLAGHAFTPLAVRFRHAPLGPLDDHAAFFGVAPSFHAEQNLLVLDADTLALPVRGAELSLRDPLLRLVQSHLAPQPAEPGDSIIVAVQDQLRRRLQLGDAGKATVARALGMSSRTLTRRLGEAGARYDRLLEDTRRALATTLLAQGDLAVYEAAFLLGYSEPSTFHRAFRRWTGETPAAWRRARRVSPSARSP